ncbi:hypothetical protein ACIQHU_00985 [Streptomyces tendae]|uniref:hypothetical protein n=1 Tax=Streptomyces tendae TaxID=1932 RepID=UPI00381EB7B7
MAYEPWQPGMIITAGRLASISPTWQDWTPAWTTSGASTPSFGNATVSARWAQSALTVYYRIDIVFGSTTNFGGGTDNWRLSAPVTAAGTSGICGTGEIQNTAAASSRQPIRVRLTTTTTFEFEMSGGNIAATSTSAGAGLIDAATPGAWVSGSSLRLWGTYEAAA